VFSHSLSCCPHRVAHTLAQQAKSKVLAAAEAAVKSLKDDAQKNGQIYVKFIKKAVEKVWGLTPV
jgi:hypothetical protein